MDPNTYINIFETKGLEYILTILYFAILIPFWIVLNNPKVRKYLKDKIKVITLSILKIPRGIFFSKNYTWSYLEKSGLANVGVNDLFQHFVGNVEVKHIRKTGDLIRKGQIITLISKNDKILKISSPISGEIVKINKSLEINSELLNDNPYNKGWFYSIKPSDWSNETKKYFLSEDSVNWVNNQLSVFKDFLSNSISSDNNLILQDGGELLDNTLSELPINVWNDFQKEFLNDI